MSTEHRVLVVDGDPVTLLGLERLVRSARPAWTMVSSTSARSAFELLDREPFDVVVAGMKLADMEGASFLGFVHETSPSATRVALVGSQEKAAALRAISHVHRFLTKPCAPGSLLEILQRRTHAHFDEPRIAALVGGIDALPCDRASLYRLSELVATPNRRLDDVAEVIEREPVLTAKLLHLARAPFFAGTRRGDGLRDVIASAGIDIVRVLAETACAASSRAITSTHFDGSSLRLYASTVATLAKTSAGESPHAEHCFIAGVVHEIGKWAVAACAPRIFDAVTVRSRDEGIPFEEAEKLEGAPSHAKVGAALLDSWGLPDAIVDAVAHQHAMDHESEYLDPAAAVRIAKLRLTVPSTRTRTAA